LPTIFGNVARAQKVDPELAIADAITTSSAVKPKARSVSMQTAISSVSASGDASPIMSQLY
jgi:hypothetical protein